MAEPAISKKTDKYTYGDYVGWDDGERWELIHGVAFNMTPAPTRRHQEISVELSRQLSNYLEEKSCKSYHAPFDVRLPEENQAEEDICNVVQPDIVVVCDEKKLDDKGCLGAPDLVIEILSPSTAQKDIEDKFSLYESHGVREYWVIHPAEATVLVFQLEESGRYGVPGRYAGDDKVPVGILPGLEIGLQSVFPRD